MRVITQIGEVGIKINGEEFLLRPSLLAMSQLENPVATYADLHGQTGADAIRDAAIDVFKACCNKDISPFIGMQQIGKTRVRSNGDGGYIETKIYTDSYIDDIHLVAIAHSLIYHGIIGDAPKRPVSPDTPKPKYSDKFDAAAYATTAMAHLGMSSADAWNLTMTELLLAFHAKFPPSQEDLARQEALDDYDRAAAWRDKIFKGETL